jgi:hypothetical protein
MVVLVCETDQALAAISSHAGDLCRLPTISFIGYCLDSSTISPSHLRPGPIGVAVIGSCTQDVHRGYRNNGAGDGKFPDAVGAR